MPHEIEIELVHRRRRSHRPMGVIRYSVADRTNHLFNNWADHIYRSPSTLSPYSSLQPGWLWNYGGWIEPRAMQGDQGMAWAYEITFRDGTRGVCRVADINEALADLGARVDRRGDAQR